MSKARIYIVEDERIIALDLQKRLERLDYSICGSATSGEEALSGIREQLPDLVLMDIVIQGDMDGIAVAMELKKELHIPVIFLSTYTDEKILERAKDANPLGYILKPFKERELSTILEMALFKSVADSLIREKEQMFAAILNSTTDAILVVNRNDEILFLNPEAELILETDSTDCTRRKLGELFTLSDMETGEWFTIPRNSSLMKAFKAPNLRLTNCKQNSFIVELTVNRETPEEGKEQNYIISFKDISRLHEMTDTLKYQTSHDTLTDLLNRNEMAIRMNTSLIKLEPQSPPINALYIDIDHFKVINDSCGTEAGDVLLKETATRIKYHMSEGDYAARVGGDDFVLVHFDPTTNTGTGTAAAIARRLIEETRAHPFRWNNKEYPISISIGIVTLDASFVNEHNLMIAGTQTVKNAHESGGNRLACYVRGDNRGFNTISVSEWLGRIHEALLNDGFKLYYQPIEPLAPENHHAKLEVLLRMTDKDGSIIPPGEFIPIAERYNIMTTIDRWVVQKSIETFARLRSKNSPLADCIFCINLCGASLADDSIIGYIIDNAEKYDVPPEMVCIEVTETNAILNLASASRFIRILKERGFTFALDDFGSGFSSFSYLKNLPVDYLKIDGCFIRNMDKDTVDRTMVQAITSMCKVLGLKTIGEFAENTAIIELLREIGVDYAQGYGISKPKPFDAELN